MVLCIFLAVIAGAAMLWIIRPLIGLGGGRLAEDHAARAAGYRAALGALEADRARALIAPAEAAAERAALGRALLAESAAQGPEPVMTPMRRWIPFALAGALPILGLLAYFVTGMNEGRPSLLAYSEDATIEKLVGQIVKGVERHPKDPEGHRLLGVTEGARGHYGAAARHYGEALALGARTPETLMAYGEMLSLEAGRPTPEALAAFDEAVARAPKNIRARIDRAEARFAFAQYAGVQEDLRAVLEQVPPDSPMSRALASRIAEAGRLIKGAGGGSENPDAQAAMIQGMVDRLAQRLEADPKNLPGWIRLVHSYAVLGDREKAAAALARARQVFAGDEGAKPALDQAEKELR